MHYLYTMPSDLIPTASDTQRVADVPIRETAERFLRSVISEIPLGLIEELHLFSPLRQGTIETGIAVLAVRIPALQPAWTGDAGLASCVADAAKADCSIADETQASADPDVSTNHDHMPVLTPEAPDAMDPIRRDVPGERLTVYTARYCATIKGPERGKWESVVRAEADAPLVTVKTVVRGVQRRSGEGSGPVRYSASQLAKVLRVANGEDAP